MSHHRSPTSSRRVIAVKRAQDEPLTRRDLQYDFLRNIFSDSNAVFTNPWPNSGGVPEARLTFQKLYIRTMLNSGKATKNFRERIKESEKFAEDFAMLALLVNVGRINTTMSFFPEMKTTLRSYHPVPALQRTSGNLQDTPRIKHILKAVTLDGETGTPPCVPIDILSRLKSGHVPPTNVFNLIFCLVNHSSSIGQLHLSDNIDFVDLFMKTDLSSESRAKAFLWLCFNYLESSTTSHLSDHHNDAVIINPFGDPRKDGKPYLVRLDPNEVALENVDPPEEIKLAEDLLQIRASFVQSQQSKEKDRQAMLSSGSGSGSVIGDDGPGEDVSARKLDNPFTVKIPRSTIKGKKSTSAAVDKMPKGRKQKAATGNTVEDTAPGSRVSTRQRVMDIQNQHPPPNSSSGHQQFPTDSEDVPNYRYAPYRREHTSPRQSLDICQTASSVPPLSFLEYAWRKVTTADPLADSDDDGGGDDEHARYEYMQRLRVLAGFLGTPSSEN
ncbi:hypothetical protein Ac2012v2_000497 [Leucoagaricus gongylophorus]